MREKCFTNNFSFLGTLDTRIFIIWPCELYSTEISNNMHSYLQKFTNSEAWLDLPTFFMLFTLTFKKPLITEYNCSKKVLTIITGLRASHFKNT